MEKENAVSDLRKTLFQDYKGGEEMPLLGYSTIVAAFNGLLLTFLNSKSPAFKSQMEKLNLSDLLLLGVSTHKLTRVITKDWVTSPLRAPFTEYQESVGSGELKEKSRGKGLQRAVGDLLTCNYCSGPWVALGLYWTLVKRPGAARKIMSLFSAVAVSDFLHMSYEVSRAYKNKLESEEKRNNEAAEKKAA